MKGKLKTYLVALILFTTNRVWGFSGERTVLMPFKNTPFPLKPSALSNRFFDISANGRRGHTSLRGEVYWEDTHYSDNRVLLSLAPSFSAKQTPLLVVYLHGNQATLERDVRGRQQVHTQLAQADLNALLVAPQFAVDAADSSEGHFAEQGYFAEFLDEVAARVGDWQGNPEYAQQLRAARVVLVAYSGGYRAAARILEHPENSARVSGVILLDGLYAYEHNFADWIAANRERAFFFSSYTASAHSNNEQLQQLLHGRGINFERALPEHLTPGSISFLQLNDMTDHYNFVNHAWTEYPLRDLLRRIKL